MKNISLALNIVLTIALIILYLLHFSGKNVTGESSVNDENYANSDFTIAYIHSDSLLNNYQFVTDENTKLRKRTTEIERDYKSRAEGLQKELNDYQANYGNLTIGQARTIEGNLAQKEQNLRLFQESARQELLEMESEISRQLYTTVTEFLSSYSEENGIQMVVKFDTSSDVLYAGKGLDITSNVIKNLNAAYLNPNGVQTAADTTSVR